MSTTTAHYGEFSKEKQAKHKPPGDGTRQEEPYEPKGNSPTGYFNKKIDENDVLLGDGFLEREGAALLAGPSGIGKSSIAMQMGCCWACGTPAFDFKPPRALRIVMMQHEDSQNDLVRQSAIVEWLGLNKGSHDAFRNPKDSGAHRRHGNR